MENKKVQLSSVYGEFRKETKKYLKFGDIKKLISPTDAVSIYDGYIVYSGNLIYHGSFRQFRENDTSLDERYVFQIVNGGNDLVIVLRGVEDESKESK